MNRFILDTHRINEESCDADFQYLIDVFTLAIQVQEPVVYIEVSSHRTVPLKSYTQFTPALHYSALIHRLVKSNRTDVLDLLDQYQDGLVQWWNVLYEAFYSLPDLEKVAWDGILRRKQSDIHIMFFLHPKLFAYTYKSLCSLPYHSNVYDIRSEFKKQALDPVTNSISKEWMLYDEARNVFEEIRSSHYRRDDCLENRYIEYLQTTQEKQYKVELIKLLLPDGLRDVITYIVNDYL